MDIGLWVVLAVILFVIGNLMGAKPNIHEMRLSELRLLARQRHLYPKLIATPKWLGDGTIAQYTKVDDTWRLPLVQLKVVDGTWQLIGGKSCLLESQPVILGNLSPYICGLAMQSNSISIFWHDELYVRQFLVRDKEAMSKIQSDIQALEEYLRGCLEMLSN